VSFQRPNPYSSPEAIDSRSFNYPGGSHPDATLPLYRTEHLLAGELRVVRWLAREGRSYSVLTDDDIDRYWTSIGGVNYSDFERFKTVIISTHSEYWSDRMYLALIDYLNKGGNVVIISGNSIFRRVIIDRGAQQVPLTLSKNDVGECNKDTYEWDHLAGIYNKRTQLGFLFTGEATGITDVCIPFTPTAAALATEAKSAHWSLTGLAAGLNIGVSGAISSPSSRCANQSSGASGEELDMAAPTFARDYTIVASRSDALQSHIMHMRRASAGQVFLIGGITAGATLVDGSDADTVPDPGMSRVMLNTLNRLNALSFSDFSSDGHTDLIARQTGSSSLRLYESNGVGGLEAGTGTSFGAGFGIYDAIVSPGDFDGDGKSDLLARSNGSLFLHRGNGTGGVQGAGAQLAGIGGWTPSTVFDLITPGDFDDDGRPDLITRTSSGFKLFRGDGAGGFVRVEGFDLSGTLSPYQDCFSPGDFGGASGSAEDGNPDLICRDTNGRLWLYLGIEGGTLWAPSTYFESGWGPFRKLIAAGDFDHDAHADVLAVTQGGANGGSLLLYRGTGHGGFFQGTAAVVDSGYDQFSAILSVW
jgi:hypothetical protein